MLLDDSASDFGGLTFHHWVVSLVVMEVDGSGSGADLGADPGADHGSDLGVALDCDPA